MHRDYDFIFVIRLYLTRFFKEGYYKYALAVIACYGIKAYIERDEDRWNSLIRENMSIGKAQLIEISPRNPKAGAFLDWIVYVDTFVFKESILYKRGDLLVKPGIWVPVAYRTSNPKTYEILWNPGLFSEFGVPIPDSLAWMNDFHLRW